MEQFTEAAKAMPHSSTTRRLDVGYAESRAVMDKLHPEVESRMVNKKIYGGYSWYTVIAKKGGDMEICM